MIGVRATAISNRLTSPREALATTANGDPGGGDTAVATAPDGSALGERSRYIGEATNNVAEYRAIQLGIELARELGASEVELVNDSQLVARQIGGEYKVKHPGLQPLYVRARLLVRRPRRVVHRVAAGVGRVRDRHADRRAALEGRRHDRLQRHRGRRRGRHGSDRGRAPPAVGGLSSGNVQT